MFIGPYAAAASRPDGKFLALFFGPFQHFLDARGIPGLNQLSEFTQRSLVRTDAADDILPVPKKNVAPHFRRAGSDTRRVPQSAAGVPGQVERRHLTSDVNERVHEGERRHMRQVTDGS